MKKKYRILSLLTIIIFCVGLVGCSNNKSSGDNEIKITKSQMRDYYLKEYHLSTRLISKYADSLKHNQNLLKPAAKDLIDYSKKINGKLKNNSINKHTSMTFINYNNALINWTNGVIYYLTNNNPNKITKYSKVLAKYTPKLRKELNISKNYSTAESRRANKKVKDVTSSLPQVKGKTAITNDSKIEITGSQMVPGQDGKKTLLVYYTATNLMDDPREAYKLLLEAGNFEQDNGNSYSRLNTGNPDFNWDSQHRDIHEMDSNGILSQLKPNATGKYATFLTLSNDQNPVLYQVHDPETREKLGTIKIPLNN